MNKFRCEKCGRFVGQYDYIEVRTSKHYHCPTCDQAQPSVFSISSLREARLDGRSITPKLNFHFRASEQVIPRKLLKYTKKDLALMEEYVRRYTNN